MAGNKSKRRLRQLVWSLHEHRCIYCRTWLKWATYTVEHVIPQCKGGPNSVVNCRPCCSHCNGLASELVVEGIVQIEEIDPRYMLQTHLDQIVKSTLVEIREAMAERIVNGNC